MHKFDDGHNIDSQQPRLFDFADDNPRPHPPASENSEFVVTTSTVEKATDAKGKFLRKAGASVTALALVGAGAFVMLRGETEALEPGNIPTTSAPVVPGPQTSSSIETPGIAPDTVDDTAERTMSISEMLESFVDENGNPNKQIKVATDNPEDFVRILYHNASCAINTRNIACADNIYYNEKNSPILQETITEFASLDLYAQVVINEIISVETNARGEIDVLVNVTDNLLIKTPTFEGRVDYSSIERLTLVRYADDTLANTNLVVEQNLDD